MLGESQVNERICLGIFSISSVEQLIFRLFSQRDSSKKKKKVAERLSPGLVTERGCGSG